MTTMDYIIAKVKGFHIANMTLAKWKLNYDRVRKEFWQTVAVLAGIVLLIVVVAKSGDGGNKGAATSDTPTAAMEQTAAPDYFDEAIAEYCRQTGRKIYPSGRVFLLNAAQRDGLRTKGQVLELIRQNEKFMWK